MRATDAAGNTDETPAVRTWTVAPACTTATVGADRDSWVLQSASGSNFGTDSILKVDSKSGSSNARALVRFNLPTVPAGCQVTQVKLRLYAVLLQVGPHAAGLPAERHLGRERGDLGQPADDDRQRGHRAVAVERRLRRVDGHLAGAEPCTPGSNHGFLIRDASENGGGNEQGFHSREKAPDNPPQLVVTFG